MVEIRNTPCQKFLNSLFLKELLLKLRFFVEIRNFQAFEYFYLAPSLYIQIHDCTDRLDSEVFTGKYEPVGTNGDRILYKHSFLDDQIESLSAESQSGIQKYFVYYGDDKFVFETNDNMDGLNQFSEDAKGKFEI